MDFNKSKVKTIACLFLLVLGCLTVFGQENAVIRGKIKHIEDGSVMRLFRESGSLLFTVEQDTVRKGRFTFQVKPEGTEPEPLLLLCSSEGFPNRWREVWIAPGKQVKITGKEKLLLGWTVKSNVPEQRTENAFMDVDPELLKEIQLWAIRADECMREIGQAEENAKATLRKDLKKVRVVVDSLDLVLQGKILERLERSPLDVVGMRKLRTLCGMNYYMKEKFPYRDRTLALFNRLTEEQQQTKEGKEMKVNLFPPRVVQVGDEMADGDLFDLQGNVHHLSDYAGKYRLLDFWSRGCGPCLMALPELKEVAEKYRDQLVVVSLSTDDKKNWEEISREKEMTWENLNDLQEQTGMYAKYGVIGVPHFVLISPEGKILYSRSGYGDGLLKLIINKWMVPEGTNPD